MQETQEIANAAAEALTNKDASGLFSVVIKSDLLPLLLVILKIGAVLVSVVLLFLLIDLLVSLFHREIQIGKFKIGNSNGPGFHRPKKQELSQDDKAQLVLKIKKSIVAMATEISVVAEERQKDLTKATRKKIDKYINSIVELYKSSIEDNYRGKNKDELLASECLEYLRELMSIASYDKKVIEDTLFRVREIMDHEKNDVPTQTIDDEKYELVSEVRDSFKEIFITNNYPFNDKIDSKTADKIIEESAKKQVIEILESLESSYEVSNEKYDSKIKSIIENYETSLKEDIK